MRLTNQGIFVRRFCSSSASLRSLLPVQSIIDRIDDIDIDDFRRRAFIPETPLLIKGNLAHASTDSSSSAPSIPAAAKWFARESIRTHGESSKLRQRLVLSQEYLQPFQDTILPYELIDDLAGTSPQSHQQGSQDVRAISQPPESSRAKSFHRFNAPLSLFLRSCKTNSSRTPRLYIAQAQIADLPKQLQDDLPTPRLVREAGNGDIYDANIWIGLPPTYTPLHRDPNPNLFVQLASSKQVRLYEPSVGAEIFQDVQRRIGRSSQANLRGEEMMDGPERDALDEAVWGYSATEPGFEAVISPGEGLFIPKGWWHTIKSIGTEVTASVNWWFR
jgi:hypothetical protein